jgi:hypothetical protein
VWETEHFVNEGYGWACKRCRASQAATQGTAGAAFETSNADSLSRATADADPSSRAPSPSSSSAPALPRFFREGEAEERETRLSGGALARWKDDSRRALLCPRCGVEEEIKG